MQNICRILRDRVRALEIFHDRQCARKIDLLPDGVDEVHQKCRAVNAHAGNTDVSAAAAPGTSRPANGRSRTTLSCPLVPRFTTAQPGNSRCAAKTPAWLSPSMPPSVGVGSHARGKSTPSMSRYQA